MVMQIRGTGYDVFLDYRDDGYVKLDDWKNVNSNNLLSELREIAKANAIYLKEKNLDLIVVDYIQLMRSNTKKNDGRVLNEFIIRSLKNNILSVKDSGNAIRRYIYIISID